MFNKNEEKSTIIKDAETIIGPSVKVSGEFQSDGNIIIEGTVEGSITTLSNLFIGDKAKIIADIKAKEARIGGEINGNITINNYLEIAASAKITGNIECSIISIAKGAIINGSCLMKTLSNE